MDSLNDILSRKNLDEPAEVTAIKSFVKQKFKVMVGVQVGNDSIVITAGSAALANSLRLQTPRLQEVASTTKRLVFRIS